MIKLSNLIVASIFTTLLAFPSTVKAEGHPLVGKIHPPLPEVAEDRGGWLIEADYTVKEVFVNQERLLLLNRLIKRNSQGKGLFEVVDVLILPTIAETEEIAGGDCFVEGQEDRHVIFIMKSNENTPFLTKARKAWRVEGEAFKEISVRGLQFKCENYSYGL